ncbi:hypothetical protein ZWY2020_003439 [Hordeum vulgare]|nr:hypothetical protein ZWY2020_003439 [Hordeum vulgare]
MPGAVARTAAKAHAPSVVPDPNSPTTAEADPLGTARPRALPAPDQNTTGTTAASAELALASQVPDSQPVSPAAWSGQSGVALTPAARVPHDAPDQTPWSSSIVSAGRRRTPPSGLCPIPSLSSSPWRRGSGTRQTATRLSATKGTAAKRWAWRPDEGSSKPCAARKRGALTRSRLAADGIAIDAPGLARRHLADNALRRRLARRR